MLVSSGEVYGPPERLPVDETAPLRPQNPYAVSKAACDLLGGQYADAHGLRVVRMRAFNHAGPGPVGRLRRRDAHAPGRRGRGRRRGGGRAAHGQPGLGTRLHGRPRRGARLRRGRRPRAGRLQRLQRAHRHGARPDRDGQRGGDAAGAPRGRPRPRPGARRSRGPRLGGAAARGDRLGAGDRAERTVADALEAWRQELAR